MDSYLEKLSRELEETIRTTGFASTPLADGKWSPAQTLEHLFLTYKGTNAGVARCLETGQPMASPRKFMDRVRTFAVVRAGYFPSGRKSPERAIPKGIPADEVQRSILPEIQKMDAGFEECIRRFGPRTRLLDHPVLGPLTVEEWRRFHYMHGRHHARQIRERAGGK